VEEPALQLKIERVVAPGPTPTSWILFLHGIFGSGRNWSSIARRVVAARPEWGVVLVDLRQHGASTGFSPPHTVQAAAADLRGLVEAEDIPARAVLGHSFGGKVALLYGGHPARHLDQLWIIDSTPDTGRAAGAAWEMLKALRRLPDSYRDRAEGVRALEEEGIAGPVAHWMATNLVRGADDSWRWRIDADDMEALLQSFSATDAWHAIEHSNAELDIHFVKAAESSVLSPGAMLRIEEAARATGRVHLHPVDGGHWVNADNPDALVRLVTEGLPR